jgi:hypothetical protein
MTRVTRPPGEDNGRAVRAVTPRCSASITRRDRCPARSYGHRLPLAALRQPGYLFTVEADGTRPARRTSSPAHELEPDWSADGESLVAQAIVAEFWKREIADG